MAKTLVFRRTEYVRDYYEFNCTEKDYNNFVDYLSKQTDEHNITRYNILKDLSFEDICMIFNNEKDDIQYELNYQDEPRKWSHIEFISEYIRDMFREYCWSNGCYDSDCDDSYEEYEVIETNE